MENDYKQWQMITEGHGDFMEEESSMSLRDYMDIAKQRKWVFILPFAIVTLIAGAFALLLPPKYQASATILIESQEIPSQYVASTVTGFAEQRLQQIYRRITSTSRLLEVIQQFDLYHKAREQRASEYVVDQMRDDVKMELISTEVMDQSSGRKAKATIAFSLAYESKESPDIVQQVTNVLVSRFLQENLDVRQRQSKEATRFFDDEMQKVQDQLAQLDVQMARFKEKNINELPELLQVNIQGLQATENTLERQEEQLRSLKEREGYLQTQLANLSPFMENSDRTRLESLGTQLVELQTRFSDEHPDVVKAKAEIVALQKKLAKAFGSRAAKPMEPDNPAYITLASQLASVQSEILSVTNQIKESKRVRRRYQKRIEKTPAVEREYREITIKQANLREKFNDLMGKHMEANVAYGLEKEQKGERFTLIEPPLLPEKPFKPNRIAIALVGVVLGFGAGIGCVVLREWADQSVRNEDKLAEQIGLPVLGSVPGLGSVEERQYTVVRRSLSVAAALAILIAGVVIFHYYVMDLDVLWARLGRKFPVM